MDMSNRCHKQILRFKKIFTPEALIVLCFFMTSLILPFSLFSQSKLYFDQNNKAALSWADSILQHLSLEEKIAQCLMIDAYSGSQSNQNHVEWVIEKYGIGGILFFKGNPTHQVMLTNHYQQLSPVPLFIAMDAEWGVSMRLDSIMNFPKQMTLGAVQDNSLIYEMGKEIALQCKRLGVNIDFAPVVDINTNPKNPVIHLRSFGEDKKMVSEKAIAYLQGLQDNGILAVAKHFPGHGDTDKDSHKDLPKIHRDMKSIFDNELYPFRKVIEAGVGGIMVAHLQVSAIDPAENMPASLSPLAVNGLLKNQMQYTGLTFTDAMNMKGVSKIGKAGENECNAFLAGNDVIVFPQNISKTIHNIKNAIKYDKFSEDALNAKVKKILIFKYYLARDSKNPVDPQHVVEDINTNQAELLNRKLSESSITLVKNNSRILPVTTLEDKTFATLSIGAMQGNQFQKSVDLYVKSDHYILHENADSSEIFQIHQWLRGYSHIIISLQAVSWLNIKTFGISPFVLNFINELNKNAHVILLNYGSPYVLEKLQDMQTVIQVTENYPLLLDLAVQALFGGIPIKGRLPVSVGSTFKQNDGIDINKVIRLKYTIPEELGLDSKALLVIDSIANDAILSHATPGCQILIAKDGKVFYHKAFGFHNYEQEVPVSIYDMYDVASITKVSSTLLPVMKLYENHKLKFDDTVGKFLNNKSKNGYSSLRIKELLLHESGTTPWIPFYKSYLDSLKLPSPLYYQSTWSEKFSIKVSDSFYVLSSIKDSIWKTIFKTPLKNRGEYNYSDLNFMLLKRIVDSLVEIPYEDYLFRNFYTPMGMNNSCFNPWKDRDICLVPESEDDNYFRHRIVKAYVHDPAAALLGGYDGHAGLFTNANDMAKLFQMFLNKGSYGGVTYYQPETIEEFTKQQSVVSRRGYGFDKPETDSTVSYSPTSRNAPYSTFGHTGFTGSCVWADPDNKLIYIFLSNRTYPDSNNRTLIQRNTRSLIQEKIYTILRKQGN